jgi:hypothetical protein
MAFLSYKPLKDEEKVNPENISNSDLSRPREFGELRNKLAVSTSLVQCQENVQSTQN